MPWKPDYLDLSEVKSWERIGDDLDNTEIAAYITGSSRAIDDFCGRQFGQLDVADAWTYTPFYNERRRLWMTRVDDITDVTGLTVSVAGVQLDAGTYTLEPSRAVAQGRAYTHVVIGRSAARQPCGIDDEVSVSCRFGWSTMPPQVGLACRLQVSRFAARRESPFGIAGSPDIGSELRLLSRVDPDVGVALRGLVRLGLVG